MGLPTSIKTALFTLLVPGTVAFVIPRLLAARFPAPRLPIGERPARIAGGTCLLAGAALYAHTAGRFLSEGEGTPSPTDDPDRLVTGGAYAHSRNPMYVAVLLVIVGQALITRSLSVCWWAAGCWIGFHDRVVYHEEPYLAEKHSETYDRYRERVPRWLPGPGFLE